MADKTLKATLIAEDKMSATFKKAGDAAKTLGQEMENAGKGADTFRDRFEAAARQVEQNNQKYEASNRVMRDVGISVGIVAGAMALAGNSYRDQEIAIDALTRGYGDAADEMLAFAQQIQDTTNFSNDAAVNAANIARTLALNYGFTADEIQQVLTLSADLAAATGYGLEDATMRVVSALRGEAESAEMLGLTLNQASIDSQNLTLTMSNQEAAHFRLNAALEQGAFAQGAAADQADTFYGSLVNVRDGVQDLNQRLGGALGPLGDIGAFAADNAVQIAAMGVAIGQVGKTAVTLKNVAQAMNELRTAQTAASLASSIGTTGIVGLGVAAAAAAVGGIYLLGKALKADLPDASQASIDSMQELIDKIVEAGDQSEYAITLLKLDDVMQDNKTAIDLYSGSAEKLADVQAELKGSFDESKVALEDMMAPLDAPIFDGLTASQKDLIDTNDDLLISVAELQATTEGWKTTAESAEVVNDGLAAGLDELGEIWQMTGEAGQDAQTKAQGYIDALLSGKITAEEFEEALQSLISDYKDAGEAALASSAAVDDTTTSVQEYLAALRDSADATDKFVSSAAGVAATLGDLEPPRDIAPTTKVDDYLDSLRDVSKQGREFISAGAGVVGTLGEIDAAQSDTAGSAETLAEGLKRTSNEAFTSGRALAEVAKQERQLAEAQEQFVQTFEEIQTQSTLAADTLETVVGAIVGGTDAIAKQAQGVQDWADKLIGAAGTYAEIDDLLQAGAITLDDYTAAQAAYNDIAAANTSIQEDVLSIQAQLAPYIAASTSALAEQMDEIANGSTDAQLFALGMMDATTSAQALSLATGYLENQEVFGPMIQQAAELNPMLAQILEEMGLISYNPVTGEVKLLGVDESQSEIELLTSAMDKLNETVATLIAILQDDASEPIGDVQNLLDDLDQSEAVPTASVSDNATPVLGDILSLLDSLDGRSVTNYVYTVGVVSGSFGFQADAARHGGVPAYAGGGVVAELAEAGRERLHFANGGYADVFDRGLYDIPPGTYVSPHNAVGDSAIGPPINVYISGPFHNTDEQALNRWAQESFIPSLRRVIQDERTGQVS